MPASWNEALQKKIINEFGEKKAAFISRKYARAFDAGYAETYPIETAFDDILHIEHLSSHTPLDTYFYYAKEKNDHTLHLRVFQWQEPIPLSDILPMLENLGLRTYKERPSKITLANNEYVWISDYTVVFATSSEFDLNKVKELFREALKNIHSGICENDGLNKLVLGALLSWRQITILRAYAKYLRQIGFRFTQAYIEKALIDNPSITQDLISFFRSRNLVVKKKIALEHPDDIEKRILHALESVSSLDEDRIFRRLLELMKATLRTNYFQLTQDQKPKDYLSFKLSSRDISELPQPAPLYEIFVYSPRFEAIHLRAEKVARGGIRWSDRPEDFRTEVLGLMKAQKVKNAIIVPSGAKGGFALKTAVTKENLKAEVLYCYKSFIRGLLDLTDNIKNKKIISPENVVCHDDADPYLVVAADKGTATFSDIANAISAEYQFWLGDAFASGGSHGYDHKEIGITARGAWESIKRHFREFDIDVLKTDITVVGIGDMSGDVFGNGMIYSKHIKLVAAFDHRNIFIDPTPDTESSFKERLRLFKLPTSSWEDYNAKLISKGGGVFKRSLKSITITSQMQQALGIEEKELTPTDLVRAILKAPVDLLYNGGIGTYVKASTESNADVMDRANDYCRVNGIDLRTRVVCEGGNLGFTQLGRIEYALNKGLINTDFIDNSAGVDCSDHEVNLKILLDQQVHLGKLTEKKRDELLVSLTDQVADLVLEDNYKQALVMSFSMYHAEKNVTLHQNYIKELEAQNVLKRSIEFLPPDKVILDRKAAGIGLTRPELAVLLAYSKIHLKSEILKTDLTEDPFLRDIVKTAFPSALDKKYSKEMEDHRLHKDIIATQLSNYLINEMGFTYVYRVQMETGATVAEIVRAFAVSTRIFDSVELQNSVEKLDFKIPMQDQYEMLFNIRLLLNLSTRWFLHTSYLKLDLENLVDEYASRIKLLEPMMPTLMGGSTREYLDELVKKFQSQGLSVDLARRIGSYRAMYAGLNIIDISLRFKLDLTKTARIYFAAGERFNLLWFRDQIAGDSREGHWNILARLTLRDELDICQRAFTYAILKDDKKNLSEAKLIDNWVNKNPRVMHRWEKLLNMLYSSAQIEYSMFFIAIRELLGLIITSD